MNPLEPMLNVVRVVDYVLQDAVEDPVRFEDR